MPIRRFLIPYIVMLSAVGVFANTQLRADDALVHDRQFFMGNVQFTLLHELAHAFISQSDIPVLGDDEVAADELAIMAFLLSDAVNAHSRLLAAADGWLLEWALEQEAGEEIPYWDDRPLKIQRFYKIVCLIYGSDPDTYATHNRQLRLPYERSWSCIDDYRGTLNNANWVKRNQRSLVTGTVAHKTSARVGVVFEAATTDQREGIATLLRQSQVIETTANSFTKLFPLRKDLNIVLTNGCQATAYFREDLNEIILCYELVERFMYLAQLRHCVGPKERSTPMPRPPDTALVKACIAKGRD